MSTHEVWSATVDDNVWRVRVVAENNDSYKGTMTIIETKTGEVVHESSVGVAFGAPFGPDMGDVDEWGHAAMQVIESIERERNKSEAKP